jgi:hypothetical protein
MQDLSKGLDVEGVLVVEVLNIDRERDGGSLFPCN